MDELKIFWTNTAIEQRNYIFEYWNKRNGNKIYSRKLNISIKERTTILKTNPGIGKPTNFKNIRTISLGHYSIFYQKQKNRVYITSFWDNRQDQKKLLNILKEGK